jgi:hypothetical protein
MEKAEFLAAPWETPCSPGWLYMSATAQGTVIYRELRESERQAFETLALAAASQEPMLRCRWRGILAIWRSHRIKAGQL